jgi:hypothetical protein
MSDATKSPNCGRVANQQRAGFIGDSLSVGYFGGSRSLNRDSIGPPQRYPVAIQTSSRNVKSCILPGLTGGAIERAHACARTARNSPPKRAAKKPRNGAVQG